MKLDKIIFDVETKKPVSIDLDKIVKGRALFQANSGGGKSYITRKFLEEANGKIQQIIIDPEGEFPTLREKYDYLLVGKDNADIQIDIRHAELLAKKLMETRADAILDLYEMSPFERIRFVKIFVEALVNLPKKLWHPCIVVIDEIHTFAPESSKGRSESLEAVASLASRGRKRGYALVGATQKLSKFHKDVAAELNTKFTGRCTLDIDQKRAAQELGIKDHTQLRNLDHEFFVFGPGIEGTIRVKSYPVKTTHEDIGSADTIKLANPNKIKKLKTEFLELPQEAENELKTTEDLKRKISELTIQNSQLKRQQPTETGLDSKQANLLASTSFKEGYEKCKGDHFPIFIKYEQYCKGLADKLNEIQQIAGKLNIEIPRNIKWPNYKNTDFSKITIPPTQIIKEAQSSVNIDKGPGALVTVTELPLGRCERSILETLAKFNESCSKAKIGIFAGYSSKSGGFNNAVSKLKSSGLVIAENGTLSITNEGIQEAGNVSPLPSTNDEILAFWKNKTGKCPGAILETLVPIYPNSMSKEDVGNQTNYSANSGGFNNSISKLKTLGLIEANNGQLKATEDMFP